MVRVGISGWRYPAWRGVFYPPKLPQRRELEYAAKIFQSIEINGTFYSLQRPESFRRWFQETPDDFVFSVKGGRYITHMRKLRAVETALANFFASGLLALGPKLGPVLWQLPPQMKFDATRLEEFFALLPRSGSEAVKLARTCDDRMLKRAHLDIDSDRPLRHALEIRHDSFVSADFIELLRRHNIGLVIADTVEWPLLFDVTSDFAYIRLHGSEQLYASGYEEEAIELWSSRILALAAGNKPRGVHAHPESSPKPVNDLFVYFDNDMKVRAPIDAQALQLRLRSQADLHIAEGAGTARNLTAAKRVGRHS